MNKATESKLILAELGQEVTMTLPEFIDAGGWIEKYEDGGYKLYYLGHTAPNIRVILINYFGDSIFIPLKHHFSTVGGEEFYSSLDVCEAEIPEINYYETVPFKESVIILD